MNKSFLGLLVCALLLSANESAFALYFWDANGSASGAGGGGAPGGTWGVDAYWNTNGAGFGTGTVPWDAGYAAVFAAGNDASGTYVVNVQGTQQVADIHVDLGDVTFQGGTLSLLNVLGNGTNRLLSAGHKTDSAVARYNTPLTAAHNIIRYKRGTLILGATNTYTGSMTIEGGVLQLGAPHVLPANTLILANNDPIRPDFSPLWQNTPAVLATGGFSQNLGPLQLAGTDPSVERRIDFGDGASTLAFADSHSEDWGGLVLVLVNYTLGVDSLRFGTSSDGLSETQLGLIEFPDFNNLPARIDANGFVTPTLPVILSVNRTSLTEVEITWSAVVGRTYRAQFKDSLQDADWTDISPDVPAGTSTVSVTNTSATSLTRFYRIAVLP